MVEKVVAAIGKKENALIESPTGSGKTLGLLMGPCAWLHAHKKAARGGSCPLHDQLGNNSSQEPTDNNSLRECKAEVSLNSGINDSSISSSSIMAGMINALGVSSPDGSNANPCEYSHGQTLGGELANTSELNCTCAHASAPTQSPTIYYATRTHKQIAQVVAEYRRLPYAIRPSTYSTTDTARPSTETEKENVPEGIRWDPLCHTILASRTIYCINDEVIRDYSEDGIEGRCKNLCDSEEGCTFKNNLRLKFGNPRDPANVAEMRREVTKLQHHGPGFDIEDLQKAMQRVECCPYYATSRYLHPDADLVFCPFNYLIDPGVRKASKIRLEGAIVVLDEAHNIENACRDAASFAFDENTLEQCLADVANKRDSLAEKVDKLSAKKRTAELVSWNGHLINDFNRNLETIETFFKKLGQLIKSLVSSVTGIGKRLPYTFNHEQLEESLRNGDLFLYAQAKQELKGVVDEFTRINKRQDEKGKIDNLHRLRLRDESRNGVIHQVNSSNESKP